MRAKRFRPIYLVLMVTPLLVSFYGCAATFSPVPGAVPAQSPPVSPAQTVPSGVEWQPDGVIKAGEYSGSNTYGGYSIHWRTDGQFLYIGMVARTNGWVSVALQPASRMKDSDMVLGYVSDGKVVVLDLYCIDNLGSHPADTELGGSHDIVAYGGKEEGGFTVIEFKRPLITGDKYDIPVVKGVNKVIWAYGPSDSPLAKHTERGYGEISP